MKTESGSFYALFQKPHRQATKQVRGKIAVEPMI